jgi:hypothetical protein
LQQISEGSIGHRLGLLRSRLFAMATGIMAIYTRHHMPSVRFEALRGVIGEPAFDVAVDRYTIVVPEGGELAQAPGTGECAGFVRNALHQATITEEHIGAVIDDLVIRVC